jgi:hypothetical protein
MLFKSAGMDQVLGSDGMRRFLGAGFAERVEFVGASNGMAGPQGPGTARIDADGARDARQRGFQFFAGAHQPLDVATGFNDG